MPVPRESSAGRFRWFGGLPCCTVLNLQTALVSADLTDHLNSVAGNTPGLRLLRDSVRSRPKWVRTMSLIQQTSIRNQLLSRMPVEDFDLLQPHLRRVQGPLRLVMIEAGEPIEHLHFPEIGFTSVTDSTGTGPVEVGMIGREGLVGACPIMLGIYKIPYRAFVQVAGENLQIEVERFEYAVAQSPALRSLLLSYVHVLIVQTAQTAISNAVNNVEVRLCRWILMCHDRVDGDRISITHEFLSDMLGVRRPGVTIAIQVLEGKHLIRARRGQIQVMDRKGLERVAGTSYGLPEAEYATVMFRPFEG